MISRNCRIALLAVCLTLLLCGGALAASLTIHAPEEAKQGSAVKVRVVIDVGIVWESRPVQAVACFWSRFTGWP